MNLNDALGKGGWLVALAVGAAAFFGGDVAEPLDRVDNLVAGSPAEESICPPGWANTSSEADHAIVLSCSKDGYLVILDQGGAFQYAWQDGAKDFEYDAGKAGWPGP